MIQPLALKCKPAYTMNMLTLILDTSTDYSLMALADGSELIAEYPLGVGRASQTLLPQLQGFLKCHGYQLQDLKAIAVGIGPGAFTGTRIAVTIAKALGFALSIPLLPFCSLRAFKPLKPGPFNVLVDAKGSAVYALSGNHSNTTTYNTPELLPLDALGSGPFLSPQAIDLQAKLNNSAQEWHSVQPSAKHLASQLQTLTPIPATSCEVLYLRTP